MRNPIKTDTIVITDRGSCSESGVDASTDRRHFIRTGGAIVLAGAAAAVSGNTLASDCDRSLGTEQKNPDQAGSDTDTGASGDRNGCGRKRKIPKMTRTHSNPANASNIARNAAPVVKVKA